MSEHAKSCSTQAVKKKKKEKKRNGMEKKGKLVWIEMPILSYRTISCSACTAGNVWLVYITASPEEIIQQAHIKKPEQRGVGGECGIGIEGNRAGGSEGGERRGGK